MSPLREHLGAQLAAGRRRKAVRCAKLALQHGAGPYADAYRVERLFWLRAASLAEGGDLTPLGFYNTESESRLTWLESKRKVS